MKTLYVSLISLSLLVLSNQVGFSNSVSIPDLSIPYDGMTLKWLYQFKAVVPAVSEERVDEETWLAVYTRGSVENFFEVREVFPDEEYNFEVDGSTGVITTGKNKGKFVSHWIPTDVSVGKSFDFAGFDTNATVISKNAEVYLPKISGGVTINAFELQSYMIFEEENDTHVVKDFFDKNTGVRVKTRTEYDTVLAGYFAKIYIEITLTESGVDNDDDGLTDYEELFATLTNPIKSDSDGDLWKDSADMMPNNFLLPNGLIIALVVIISISGIIAYKFLQRRKALTKTESVSQMPQEVE